MDPRPIRNPQSAIHNPALSRRDWLKTTAATAALLAAGQKTFGEEAKKKIPVGLQLYSVREVAPKDVAGTFKAIKEMGYEGVEFAGYYKPAADLRKLLDDNGLKCCGTHTGLNTLLGNELKKTIEFNKTIGNRYLIVPGMGADRLGTKEKCIETAKLFTELAEKLKPEGMVTGYHAHGADFKKLDDTTPWEVLFSNAGPDVVMQMDTGNCMGGGGDPVALLKKFPGRALSVHLKEHGGGVIGEGKVAWKDVFELCETTGKTEWYIVEEEGGGQKALEVVKRALDNLRKMGK